MILVDRPRAMGGWIPFFRQPYIHRTLPENVLELLRLGFVLCQGFNLPQNALCSTEIGNFVSTSPPALGVEYGGSGHKQTETPSDLDYFFLDLLFGGQRRFEGVGVIEN